MPALFSIWLSQLSKDCEPGISCGTELSWNDSKWRNGKSGQNETKEFFLIKSFENVVPLSGVGKPHTALV
jgi:hypothetical protein